MQGMLATVLLCATGGAHEPAQEPLRALVAQRLAEVVARSGFGRLDFDERWNEHSATSAAVDGLANVVAPGVRDVSYVELPIGMLAPRSVTGLLVHAFGADDPARSFLVTEMRVFASPTHSGALDVRRVRLVLPGKERQVRLAEVRLHGDGLERGLLTADQSSLSSTHVVFGFRRDLPEVERTRRAIRAVAQRALDGFAHSVRDLPLAVTEREDDPWWEVDLGRVTPLRSVEVFGDPEDTTALEGFVVVFFDAEGHEVWRSAATPAPASTLRRSVETGPTLWQPLAITAHSASSSAPGFELARALLAAPDPRNGWAPAASHRYASAVVALPPRPRESLALRLEMRQDHGGGRVLERFGAEVTCAEALVPPLPAALYELADPGETTALTPAEVQLAERFLRATAIPGGPFELADGELVRRTRERIEHAAESTRALVEALSQSPSVGVDAEQRLELAAFLVGLGE